MNKINPTKNEVVILLFLSKEPGASLITARKRLSMNLDDFLRGVKLLEGRGFVSRDGVKVILTSQGIDFLSDTERLGRLAMSTSEYIDSVSTTALAVTEFYLPNRAKFLASLSKVS